MDTSGLRSLMKQLEAPNNEDTFQKIEEWSIEKYHEMAFKFLAREKLRDDVEKKARGFLEKYRAAKLTTGEDRASYAAEFLEVKPLLDQELKLSEIERIQVYALERIVIVAFEKETKELDELEKLVCNPQANDELWNKINQHDQGMKVALEAQAKKAKNEKLVSITEEFFMWICLLATACMLKKY